jgi:hypothetical protein
VPELTSAPASSDRAVLPRDVALFLPLFGITLHKCSVYPENHPLLKNSIDAVASHLRVTVVNRPFLLMGVARTQLLVEGFATDPDNPVLRELAGKLHRHQLGAIKFTSGVTQAELAEVLRVLCTDSRQHPLGDNLAEYDNRWEHIRLLPPAYDRLELAEGEQHLGEASKAPASAAGQMWMALAAVAVEAEGAPELRSDPRAVAEALNKMRDPDKSKRVINYLLGLSRELRLSAGQEAAMLKERLAQLFTHIKPETLKEIASIGSDLAQRRRLVVDGANMLPAGSVITLLRAVSEAGHQSIPQAMVRLLTKLALQADKGAQSIREEADLAMREAVRQLVNNWELDDPNPVAYSRVLERLSRHPSGGTAQKEGHSAEAIRLVEMSLETDTVGDAVWAALEELVMQGDAGRVVRMVEDPNVAEDIQEQFWLHLATPANMRIMLSNEPRDTDVVEMLLERMGMAAAEPMLESLEVAENRTMRRRLLTRLGRLGPEIGPMLVERLPGAPWYVQRNLLALLGALPEIPADFAPAEYVDHDDARVRREAVKLLLRLPGQRDEAILAALGDDDDGNVRLGLNAALNGCPAGAVARLLVLLNDPRAAVDVQTLTIRVLGTIRSVATRDWLVGHAMTRATWFRKSRLQPKTPLLLAVVSALSREFRDDPATQEVLQLARANPDADIRRASTGVVEEA